MRRHRIKAPISTLITAVLVSFVLVSPSPAQPGVVTTQWRGVPLSMASNILHVRFRAARTMQAAEAVLPAGFVVSSPFLPLAPGSFPKSSGSTSPSAPQPKPVGPAREKLERTFIVKMDAEMSPMLASRWLMTKYSDVIEFAEPLYIDQLHNTPNDPFVNEQRYLAVINAFEGWDSGIGDPSVVMGLCDDGMEQAHEDLVDNIAINTNEIPSNNVDDDANGYVDDYNGYNLAWRDDDTPPGNTRNNRNNGHGTMVAGLAGATSDNSIGIAGIGRRCKIFPLKASTVDAAGVQYGYHGLIYAATRGFKVVNCSWGGVKPASPIDQSVIDYCAENDVVVVASAGNHGDDAPNAAWMQRNYPAAYPGVIGVGEVNISDHISTATGLGLNADLLAPSSDALTTTADGSYSSANVRGSSFAAPQVTGMVGLVRSKHPALNVEQVQAFVRASSKDISQLNAGFPIVLPGRIDLKLAMTRDPFTVPAIMVNSVSERYPDGNPVERIGKGDTLALTFNLKNVLAPVRDLNVSLVVSGGSGWKLRVLNPDAALGDFTSGAAFSTPPFFVVVDSIDEGQAILQLDIEAESYIDHHLHYLPQPSPMATFENDELIYSMGDNGLVAFDVSPSSRRGLGFNWKPSFWLMSPSGLLLCEGGTKGLGAFNNIDYQSDFTAIKRFTLPERDRSEMTDEDVAPNRKIGVQVTQRCTFPSISSRTTVWTVTVKNTSGTDLHDVAAGYYLDVDIGPRGEENTIRIAPEAIPVTFAAEPSAAMVVSRENVNAAVVMAAHTNNSAAVAQAASGLFNVIVNDVDNLTDADKVLLLTSDDSIQTSASGDVWGVIGMRFPGTMTPDDTRTFTVVVGVGSSIAEAAQNVMATLTDPQSVPQHMPSTSSTIRPNPASDYVIIDHPEGADVIRIVDGLGNTVHSGPADAGSFSIVETRALYPGAYRCIVEAHGLYVSLPLVVLR